MPSLRYRLLLQAVQRSSQKQVYAMDAARLLDWLSQNDYRRKSSPPALLRRRFNTSVRHFAQGNCHIIEPRGGWQPGSPVLLFLHGGGFVFEADTIHWWAVARLTQRLGARVWVCNYPLLPGHDMRASANMVFECYAAMLQEHQSSDIRVVGDSAGASLALILGHQLSYNQAISKFADKDGSPPPATAASATALSVATPPPAVLPMPRHFALISPAQGLVHDPAVREQMRRLAPKDVLLSPSILDVLAQINQPRADDPPYYGCPLQGDFSRFAPMTLFYGGSEILSALLPGFIAQVEASGGQLDVVLGEGMCHDWPYMPLAPESQAAFDRLTAALR
jgi:acetyl esterase/lipase